MAYTFDQLVNWISLWSFKSAGKNRMPLVIRGIIGKGWGQGPQHAKTLHSMFAYIPGLRVVIPSSPSEAKGLLLSSIFLNDPVIFLEYRALYNTKEYVPLKPYFIDINSPRIRYVGNKITIIAIGSGVLTSIKAIEKIKSKSEIELIDLREIANFNYDKIFKSVKKTGKLIIVEDGWEKFSIASEIISVLSQKGIKLKKPPVKICWPNSHVPMSNPLESKYYPHENQIVKSIKKMI